nr:pentatricopeptide repeat-containing protein At3g24000, mitochondrial-like isoform X1 [Ipomoea trifida]
MECECFSAQMFSSPGFSRRSIQTLYPTTKTSLIKFLNKPQLKPKHGFPFIRFYSCCSAILPTVERETALNSKFHASSGFQTLPRKLPSRKRDLERYSEMFRDYTQTKNLKEGKVLHGELVRNLIDPDMHLYVSLINFYAKSGDLSSASKVFDQMPERDVVSWTSLISGFLPEGNGSESVRLFCEMRREGVKPNGFTLATILKGCSMCLNLEFGKQLHAEVVKSDTFSDVYIGSALIDLYAKCHQMEDAKTVFHHMPDQNLVSWNALLNGYAQEGEWQEVLRLFCSLSESEFRFSSYTLSTVLKSCANVGVKPNEFTLASCVSGTSRIASLSNGRQLHCLAVKSGQFSDLFVASALADMYGKCGCIADSETLFEGMGSYDTVLWNTMICSYSQHGQGKKALQVFRRMLNEGTLPDAITFIGVLSACSHMGLVDEGRRYFESINNTYGIIPSIEHYACMIDILGRAGKFDEVKNFIEHMELTPNALIWETVLGACTIHGNIELAEKAANFLLEFEPKVESCYIMLSNIYAAKGMWSDVAKLRAFMSDQGIKKEPGCSWVEDATHPRLTDIHKKLDERWPEYNSSVSKEDFWQAESVKAEKRDEAKCTNFGRLMETHGSMVLGASYKDPIASFKQFHKFSVDHPESCCRSCSKEIVVPAAGEDVEIQLRQQDVSWKGFLAGAHHLPRPSYYTPVYQPIDSITNILFSSGTTGDPKAIPWTHLSPMRTADSWAHADVQAGDVYCWPTNLGWAMGPTLLYACFLTGCSHMYFGHHSKLGEGLEKPDCMKGLDWTRIRVFATTGEVSNVDDALWLTSRAYYKPIVECCGGTDLASTYVAGSLLQPQAFGTFSSASMSVDFVILDEDCHAYPNDKACIGVITSLKFSSGHRYWNRGEAADHAPVAAESSHGSVSSPPSSPGTIAHTQLPSTADFIADGGAGRREGENGSPCYACSACREERGRRENRRGERPAGGDDARG